jgi:hypothetical protein
MELSVHLPWFLAGFELRSDGVSHLFTVCMWWERDLVDFVDDAPPGTLRSLQLMVPSGHNGSGWDVHRIVRVWRAREGSGVEPFALEDAQGGWLNALTASAVEMRPDRYEVVAEVGPGTHRSKRVRRGSQAS